MGKQNGHIVPFLESASLKERKTYMSSDRVTKIVDLLLFTALQQQLALDHIGLSFKG